jgi:hypothetical protein
MRPRTTNTKRRAFDAYKLSFESAGALGLQTNTQGPPSHGSLYRLRLAQARMPLPPTLALQEVDYECAIDY